MAPEDIPGHPEDGRMRMQEIMAEFDGRITSMRQEVVQAQRGLAEEVQRLKADFRAEVGGLRAMLHSGAAPLSDATQRDMELYKAALQDALESRKARMQKDEVEKFKSREEWGRARLAGVLHYGASGINMLMLVNGAAVLGVLKFMSDISGAEVQIADKARVTRKLGEACMWFGAGVALAALTAVVGYVTMVRLMECHKSRSGRMLRDFVAPPLATASLLAFAAGVLGALKALGVDTSPL